MMRGPSRSMIRGALLILAAAAAGCAGEASEPTVAEALAEISATAVTPADSADVEEAPAVADVVATWAREDRMADGSLRELLADLSDRAAIDAERDDDGAGWRSALE